MSYIKTYGFNLELKWKIRSVSLTPKLVREASILYLLLSDKCWETHFWPASELERAQSEKDQRFHQRRLAPDDELQDKKYEDMSLNTSMTSQNLMGI